MLTPQRIACCFVLGLTFGPGLTLASDLDLRKTESIGLGNAIYALTNGDPIQAEAIVELADSRHQLGNERDLGLMFLADNYAAQGLRVRAKKIYRQLGERSTSNKIKDLAWLKLAKLAVEDQEFTIAKEAIYNIGDTLSNEQETERTLINGHVLLAERQPQQAVVAVPEKLGAETTWSLYQRYNLGVLLLKHYKNKHGAVLLHTLGEMDVRKNPERAALRDQANLSLGFTLIQLGNPAKAREYLKKVQLNGALSDQALLGMGWTYSSVGDNERALAYWLELQKRPLTNAFYYESLLAVPYAYSQAEAYKQAAERYQSAIDQLKREIDNLDAAQKAINDGRLFTILDTRPEHETDWVTNWQQNATPENHFLPLLMQNIKFQNALREYRSLLQLQAYLPGINDSITKLRERPQANRLQADLASAQLKYQTLNDALASAIRSQENKTDALAVEILDSYKTQLANYTRQAQFGLAQVIERASSKAGTP